MCAALLRQVVPTETVRVGFGGELETPVRGALLRGSTYLNRHFNYANAIKTIESQIGMRQTGRPGGKVLQALKGR